MCLWGWILNNSKTTFWKDACSSKFSKVNIFQQINQIILQTEDYSEEFTSLALFKTGRKVLASSDKGNLYIFNWNEFGLHSDEIPSLTKKSINCMIPITETIAVTGGEDQMIR